jgi:hypothetical protein
MIMSGEIYNAVLRIRELAEAIVREAPDFNEKWQQQSIKPKAQEILRNCDAISRAISPGNIPPRGTVGPGSQGGGAPGAY